MLRRSVNVELWGYGGLKMIYLFHGRGGLKWESDIGKWRKRGANDGVLWPRWESGHRMGEIFLGESSL